MKSLFYGIVLALLGVIIPFLAGCPQDDSVRTAGLPTVTFWAN